MRTSAKFLAPEIQQSTQQLHLPTIPVLSAKQPMNNLSAKVPPPQPVVYSFGQMNYLNKPDNKIQNYQRKSLWKMADDFENEDTFADILG